MRVGSIARVWRLAGLLSAFALMPTAWVAGVERNEQANQREDSSNSVVELFDGMSQRVIEVRFIPQSAEQAVVYLKNTDDKPLDIELPDAFGAVHVLAQVGGGYGGGGAFGAGGLGAGGLGAGGLGAGGQGIAQGGAGLGGTGQGLGGGFGAGAGLNGAALNGGGLGGGGFGGGGGLGAGGFFRVEPGKTRKLLVNTVCLEHGKPDPNPRMTYKLVPLENIKDDPAISQLCQHLGTGDVSQTVAQATAWHLANGLTWNELRQKNRHESKYTGNIRWFTGDELASAWELTRRCQEESRLTRSSLSDR